MTNATRTGMTTTMKRFFLTGTDTDAGKTLISAALLKRATMDNLSAFGLKPIASGSEQTSEGLRNRDALLHQQYSSPRCEYQIHNPITLEPAIAPHIAAQQAGVNLTVQSLTQACASGLQQPHERQLIEGAGGWLVPLNDDQTLADFAVAQGAGVILVVGLRLGCINHACLTVQAIEQAGLAVAGWVANGIDPDMDAQEENLRYLHQWFARKGIQHCGTVPHIPGIQAEDDQQLAKVAALLRWPE